MGHRDGDAQFLGEPADGLGQTGRVQSAGVGDDPHATVVGDAEALLELCQEGPRVAALGVLHPVAAQDEHGQFGKVIAGQIVQFTAGQHLVHRVEAVAVEAGAVADPYGSGGS